MAMASYYDTMYEEGAFHGTACSQLQYPCGW